MELLYASEHRGLLELDQTKDVRRAVTTAHALPTAKYFCRRLKPAAPEQPDQTDDNQIDRDDVVEQARDKQNEDAGDQ